MPNLYNRGDSNNELPLSYNMRNMENHRRLTGGSDHSPGITEQNILPSTSTDQAYLVNGFSSAAPRQRYIHAIPTLQSKSNSGKLVECHFDDPSNRSSSENEESAVEFCDQQREPSSSYCENENEMENVDTSSESSINDQEFLEQVEREQIVEKYEMGPNQKDIDPWENPDLDLYKKTDRYGFIHKSNEVDAPDHKKRVELEATREHKWIRMLKEWEKLFPTKLPQRIWKGVPDKLRLIYWMRFLNIEEMRAGAKGNLYRELLMRARLVSRDIKQIDLDINRTYRDNLAFHRRYDIKQKSLFNVLAAYAMMNTEVGYCQGMSQIAALFLMYMDEEEAFWSLHSLLTTPKYAMHGFFVPGFPKLQRFQDHYEKVLEKYLPRVKRHLDKINAPPIYLTKWWFGCFLDRIPFPLALRMWDVFLYFGDPILMAMALNIMTMHKKTILRLQMETFMEFIQTKIAENFGYSNDRVMKSLSECLKRLQDDRMALPPPRPNGLPELPTKPFCPILTRSMIDLNSEVAELHSRCSRANSTSDRSPMVARRRQRRHPTPLVLASSKYQAEGKHEPENSAARPLRDEPNRLKNDISSGRYVQNSTPGDLQTRRVGSGKERNRPPPVPDADGFVPISAIQRRKQDAILTETASHRAHSLKERQRVSERNMPQDGNTDKFVHSKTASTDTNLTSISKIHRAPNNVTYIAIEPNDVFVQQNQIESVHFSAKPHTPPPDYDYDDCGEQQPVKNSNFDGHINSFDRRQKHYRYSPDPIIRRF